MFFAALLGPIAVLMLFTMVIFLIAMFIVIAFSTSRFKDTKKASKRKGACSSMFSILGIMVLFGLTWAFGAFTVRGGPDYFRYLFVGFNSLQGFFVFLFFVVFAKETLDLWLQSCGCKRRKKRETIISAITGEAPPKQKRMMLDENADRLRAMEEVDPDSRLRTNTWDIMFLMPQNQFDVVLCSDGSTRPAVDMEQGLGAGGLRELAPPPASRAEATGSPRMEQGSAPQQVINSSGREQRSASLSSGPSSLEQVMYQLSPSKGIGHSPTHSLDSAQNAMECMSTADSGILMDKVKSTPSPPPQGQLQHPQSGSTPRHVHSVSGIGYVSAESSMETLPQREEECYINKEPITLAPSLRPRAVLNEYATVNVDNLSNL